MEMCEDSPPQGPSRGTAGQVRFPGEKGIEADAKAPAGAAAPIVMGVWGLMPPSYIFSRDFHGKSFPVY